MAQKVKTPKIGKGRKFSFAPKGRSKEIVRLTVVGGPPDKNRKDIELNRADQQYFKDLHKIVDNIFNEAADLGLTWAKLAEAAGLSYSTVDKLGDRQTRWPRYMTVYKLAGAVGWELVTVEKKTKQKASSVKVA